MLYRLQASEVFKTGKKCFTVSRGVEIQQCHWTVPAKEGQLRLNCLEDSGRRPAGSRTLSTHAPTTCASGTEKVLIYQVKRRQRLTRRHLGIKGPQRGLV